MASEDLRGRNWGRSPGRRRTARRAGTKRKPRGHWPAGGPGAPPRAEAPRIDSPRGRPIPDRVPRLQPAAATPVCSHTRWQAGRLSDNRIRVPELEAPGRQDPPHPRAAARASLAAQKSSRPLQQPEAAKLPWAVLSEVLVRNRSTWQWTAETTPFGCVCVCVCVCVGGPPERHATSLYVQPARAS